MEGKVKFNFGKRFQDNIIVDNSLPWKDTEFHLHRTVGLFSWAHHSMLWLFMCKYQRQLLRHENYMYSAGYMHDMMVVRSPWTGSLIMFWCWASLEESGLFIRAWSIPEHPLLQPVTVTLNCIEDKWRKHKQWRKHTQMVKRNIRSLTWLTQLPTESLCLIVTYIVLTRNLDSYGIVLKQVIFNRLVLSQWLKVKITYYGGPCCAFKFNAMSLSRLKQWSQDTLSIQLVSALPI